ncbi:hypothetical protein NPIL_52361 [Nephila pilipes]|uniref:Uncharacterized protein n=1 Tax=Nephila pilipes TaxID=299642 RepID=A0A8X6TZ82_NEPPI|nr:hypothetical protein NPIL_52361 [Nephila pilipes]
MAGQTTTTDITTGKRPEMNMVIFNGVTCGKRLMELRRMGFTVIISQTTLLVAPPRASLLLPRRKRSLPLGYQSVGFTKSHFLPIIKNLTL